MLLTAIGRLVKLECVDLKTFCWLALTFCWSPFSYEGQFWNVPISVEPFTGQTRDGNAACDKTFVVSVSHPDDTTRSFVACREPFTWDLQRVTCLYAGNRQGGSVYEFESPNDPVIQGTYMDYLVSDAFATSFRFSRFEDSMCNWVKGLCL